MSELDSRRHASLELLRPICIYLMKDVSKKKVRDLRDALSQVDDRIAQEIQQYILFPLQTNLRQKDLQESLLCELCEAVELVFQKTAVASLSAFFDTFNPLMFTLTPKDGSKRVILEFEETKVALLKAIKQLLKATQEIILAKIYTAQFIPALGQLVSVLLSFAELERSRAVQILALDCLLIVLQTDGKFGKKYESQLAEFFPFCLPGVTMTTCRIATGDLKQGQSVIGRAIQVFVRMVSLVLQDSSVSNTKALSTEGSSPTKKLSQKQAVRQESRTLSVERSEEWVKATASKVKVIVEQMSRLVTHDNWRVRLGLAEGWEKLLTSCCRSLSESVPKILETLVGLINDPFGNVAKKATAALEAFSAATKSDSTISGGRTLMGILKENLYALATSLPRQIKMCDEEDKPALMRLLNGYISLLGTDINSVINSSPHLNRLCLALVLILDLDVRDLRIVEERGRALDTDADTFVDEQSCAVWKPRKYFKHFRDESILSESLLACRQLGRFGNIYILVDHLLDIHQTSSAYHLATTLIINEMVLGAGCLEGENVSSQEPSKSFNTDLLPDVISMLMEEYLSERNLRLLDTVTAGPPVRSSPAAPSLSSALSIVGEDRAAEMQETALNRNRAILQMCLHMEGLAKFARVLGPARQEHLIRTLYPLVENLGHENLYISCTAYSALVEFAASGGYRTLDCLLRENADYLVSSVSLRLRHFQVNRRTPQTLCVMLKYCSKELLPHMRRSVTQLLDSLDDNYTDDLVLFMPVLLELVRAVCRWFPPPQAPSAQDSVSGTKRQVCPCDQESKNHCLNPQELKDFLEDYVATKRIAEGDFSDEKAKESMTLEEIEREIKALGNTSGGEGEETEQTEEEEDKEKEVPSHIVLVKEVFHRVRNLLSTRDGRLRVQALDVVSQGIQALKGQERELLPQVHQMWAGFRPLFNSQEKFIVVKAVKTLLVLSEAAGDFLRQRTVKEIIPGLSSFMDKQASISCDCHSGYLHTANYKLQLCILSTVGQLASNLQLDRNHLDQVARLCVPYLSDAQPHTLQQAALSSFSHFVRLDADACWLMLTHIYSPWSLTPPGPQFVPVKLPPGASKKNPYSSNISKIFAEYYKAEEYFGTPST